MSPRALAATLPKQTKPVLEKHGRAYATLIADWASIAGPALAGMSLPEKLSPGSNAAGGTLTIRVAGAAATELQHLAPQIIDRINTCLGFSAVADRTSFFVRSTWFDADFVATGVLDPERFAELAACAQALCACFAVDESRFSAPR